MPVGPVPFDYITQSAGGMAQPDPDESRAVQIAFERRANGASMGEIARWLNAQGFRPRGRNEIFSPFAVRNMLKNAFYLGMVTFRGQHEPIATEQRYQHVQARRSVVPPRSTAGGATGLLQGRLHCGRCGSKLHSERDRRHEPRYRERHGVACRTNDRSVVARRIDWQVAEIWRAVEFPAQGSLSPILRVLARLSRQPSDSCGYETQRHHLQWHNPPARCASWHAVHNPESQLRMWDVRLRPWLRRGASSAASRVGRRGQRYRSRTRCNPLIAFLRCCALDLPTVLSADAMRMTSVFERLPGRKDD